VVVSTPNTPQHQHELHGHEGRVAIDVADPAADGDVVIGDAGERQQREDARQDVEERLAEVIADLESRDTSQHQAASARSPVFAVCRVEK
jgi:hypothetical protein